MADPFRPQIAAIHLDAVGGAAGDMFVACMLDALPELVATVLGEIAAVLPAEAGAPELVEGTSNGIRALRFGLRTPTPPGGTSSSTHGDPDHAHHHHDHKHAQDHEHGHGHEDEHAHRRGHAHPPHARFPDLLALIEAAGIAAGTSRHASAILTRLAEAEARIHGVPVDEVHFHELADWDSLMDVVAAGSIAASLEGVRWTVSPLPVGSGLVRTQHGLLPVPAPATTLLLDGFVLRDDGLAGERVTPTGAAILAHLVDPARAGPRPAGRLVRAGTGAGTRSLKGMPNILRALALADDRPKNRETIETIEFEIDDMTGEEMGAALDRLRTMAGVLDASTAQRIGKKGRPSTEFRLLCADGAADRIADACFLQTSTIGLRIRREERRILPREERVAAGLRVKAVTRPGGQVTAKVESDDLAAAEDLEARRRLARGAER